jgi:hypothetical protein
LSAALDAAALRMRAEAERNFDVLAGLAGG